MKQPEAETSVVNESEESSSDDSSSMSDEDFTEEMKKFDELEEKIRNEPFVYDQHVELITLARKIGDLSVLRNARNRMSELFLLKEDIWLEWLEDEIRLACSAEENEEVFRLFNRAVKDYLSVEIWRRYVQFAVANVERDNGIENVRCILEAAVSAVGCHVLNGIVLWESYREFEIAVLNGFQQDDSTNSAALIQKQRTRILNLFERQFLYPLKGMEGSLEEYKRLFEDCIDQKFTQSYERSMKDLNARLSYENALIADKSVAHYEDYLKFELANRRHDLIICLFERAIADFPRTVELWSEMTDYMVKHDFSKILCCQAFERAVKDCPWSSQMWISYGISSERFQESDVSIKDIYNRALNSGMQTTYDYCKVWASYIHFLRRRAISMCQPNASQDELDEIFQDVRTALETAINQLYEHFGEEADPSCYFERYWALIEAKYCKNMEKARKIWYDNILAIGNSTMSSFWLEFFELETRYGTDKNCRKVLHKALVSALDNIDHLCNVLIQFEEQNGTLGSLDIALEKIAEAKKRMASKVKLKRSESMKNSKKQPAKKKVKFAMDYEQNAGNDIENKSTEDALPEVDKGIAIPHSDTYEEKNDVIKENAVFLSNLPYRVNESKVKDIFSEIGPIKSFCIAKTAKSCSKGFGHIEFFSAEVARKALSLDNTEVDGRPIYVSEYAPKDSQSAPKSFKYATTLEKNKLFVSSLPRDITQEALQRIYSEFGPIKDVRLARYRNGHSKGIAYIEYENETSAAEALLKTDGMQIEGQKISVVISNPPERKTPVNKQISSSLGSGGSKKIVRGKGTLDLNLLPRSVHMENSSHAQEKKLSNDDFRKLFLKNA